MTPAGHSDSLLTSDQFFSLINPYARTFDEYRNMCEDAALFVKDVKENMNGNLINLQYFR